VYLCIMPVAWAISAHIVCCCVCLYAPQDVVLGLGLAATTLARGQLHNSTHCGTWRLLHMLSAGHSLGGAVATLAACDLLKKYKGQLDPLRQVGHCCCCCCCGLCSTALLQCFCRLLT
jgi:hypothetical protein